MFTHLHAHSYFSFLDGAAPVRELCFAVAAMGMKALALTDHNGLYGAVRFFQAAKEAGIKPIIGVEFDVERQKLGDRSQELGERQTAPHPRPLSVGRRGENGKWQELGDRSQESGERRTGHLVLLAEDNEGYANLCRLVTAARLGKARRAGPFAAEYSEIDRKHPVLRQEDLRRHSGHLTALSGCGKGEIAQLSMERDWESAARAARYYADLFGKGRFYIEMQNNLLPPPHNQLRHTLKNLADHLNLPVVATNDVHYVTRDYAHLQDILVCIRNLRTVNEPHPDRKMNAEYSLKSPAEMAALFADMPEALAATEDIAARCNWEFDLETLHFPRFDLTMLAGQDLGHYPVPEEGEDTRQYLRRACEAGARKLYGAVTPKVRRRIDHELRIIEDQGLSDYFLVVWDICRFARSRRIPCTGRGSAADSIVSYLLEITAVDPIAHDLLFERFLNPMRRSMPDIDIDFCSARRDIVTAYVYERYGTDFVAAVCTLNTFRARSAIREIGKALGISNEEIGRLAKAFPHTRASEVVVAIQKYPEVRDAGFYLQDKGLLFELCRQISGFPRHLSVHVGGLLIGAQPLTDITPLELASKGIVIAQFDKDDVEALGLVKMDILGLRIHTAIDHALDEIERRTGERIDIERIPLDDEDTFGLIRSTKTVGMFQLESPGQRNLLGRTQPEEFEEIIANISLFRPGPVQSNMIRPYIARRHGREPITYLDPALEPVLRRTYGVIIYQEQVLEIANAVAGFTLGEGDQLRRAMTTDRSPEEMAALERPFVEGAMRKGITEGVAQEIFRVVSGFAAYGFNKAHAACFAKISYQTAWLKAHYPAEFLAGILTAEPMGFYPARTIAEEARRMGIRVLPPCVNRSEARYGAEENDVLPPLPALPKGKWGTANGDGPSAPRPVLAGREEGAPAYPKRRRPGPATAIRCGLRFIRGMSEAAVQSILDARRKGGAFTSLRDFCERTSVPRPMVENLIMARAFSFTGLSEQELLWMLAAMPKGAIAERRGRKAERELEFDAPEVVTETLSKLAPTTKVERVALDLHLLGLSTTVNPFFFWREKLVEMGIRPSTSLYECKDGDTVRVAGIVVAYARPPTRSGKTAIFICLEDEYGLVDVAVFEEAYQKHGRALYSNSVLGVEGRLTRLGLLDLSVTVQEVIGLGSWQDFERNAPQARRVHVPDTIAEPMRVL